MMKLSSSFVWHVAADYYLHLALPFVWFLFFYTFELVNPSPLPNFPFQMFGSWAVTIVLIHQILKDESTRAQYDFAIEHPEEVNTHSLPAMKII